MRYIKCNNLEIGYNGQVVLSNLNFEVNEGDYLCIIGENGAGKSTLMKTLMSLQDKKSGEIIFENGINRNEIGYLPQQTFIQKDFPATVMEVVLSGTISKLKFRPFYSNKEKQRALKEMKRLSIDNLAKKSFKDLSGGQQQRVLLARALCSTDKLIMLDEPATGLDPLVTKDFYSLLNELNKSGITIVMISHDLSVLENASHILSLNKDKCLYLTKEEYMKGNK